MRTARAKPGSRAPYWFPALATVLKAEVAWSLKRIIQLSSIHRMQFQIWDLAEDQVESWSDLGNLSP